MAGCVVDRLFVLIDLTRFEHQAIALEIKLGDLLRDEILISSADQFVMGMAHELAHRLIEGDEPVLIVLDENRIGHGVENPAKELKIGRRQDVPRLESHARCPMDRSRKREECYRRPITDLLGILPILRKILARRLLEERLASPAA